MPNDHIVHPTAANTPHQPGTGMSESVAGMTDNCGRSDWSTTRLSRKLRRIAKQLPLPVTRYRVHSSTV